MITTTTINTKKVYSDFATYNVKKNKAMVWIYVCSAIIIACAISLLIIENTTQGVLYLCLGVFFAFYGVIVRGLIILTNKKFVDTINTFTFEDTSFNVLITSKYGKEIANSKINYEALHSVKTYKNYAYIYANRVSCYILIKENFESESQFYTLLDNISKQIKNTNNYYGAVQSDSLGSVEKNNNIDKLNIVEEQENNNKKETSKNNNLLETKESQELKTSKPEIESSESDENQENSIIAKIRSKNESGKSSKSKKQ